MTTASELEAQIHQNGWYTVVGFWPQTEERYTDFVQAVSPRLAEDLAQMTAKEKGGVLRICGVFEGKIPNVDTYADWLDPELGTAAER